MHFRLYSQRDLGNGRYAVRFLMGSPRMEGLDDVQRVTSAVCDTCGPLCDEGLMSLVPDSECGMSVAEIQVRSIHWSPYDRVGGVNAVP
jgi:hypothetical protein